MRGHLTTEYDESMKIGHLLKRCVRALVVSNLPYFLTFLLINYIRRTTALDTSSLYTYITFD
jgi:hypothetical protein